MPKYRLPTFKLIWHTVLTQTIMYLKKAGTFIAGAAILIWFLSNYPHSTELEKVYTAKIEKAVDAKQKTLLTNKLAEEQLGQSYLGRVGKLTEPIFAPLGFDWKMNVALQAGLAAKEVVVSTLGVLYSIGGDVTENSQSLANNIREHIPFASAVAFIVVVMTYLPCLAATTVFAKEAGSWKYAVYLFIFTSIVAYVLAFFAYRIALAFG